MEIEEIPQELRRQKNKMLAVLDDPTSPPESQKLAAKILERYDWFVTKSPWASDRYAATFLAEINADYLWSGLRTIKEIEGKDEIVHELNPSAPGFDPVYRKNEAS